jgi:hypothetical protein
MALGQRQAVIMGQQRPGPRRADDHRGRRLAPWLLAAALAPCSAAAEPMELTAAQLDQVTAAGVAVAVDVFAQAIGAAAETYTTTLTDAFSNPWLSVAFGIGVGQAYACCGPDAEVAVGTTVAGTGGHTAGGSFEQTHDDGVYAVGITTGWVMTVSAPSTEQVGAYGTQIKDQVASMLPILAFEGVTPPAAGPAP